jgi:hypothetical protein
MIELLPKLIIGFSLLIILFYFFGKKKDSPFYLLCIVVVFFTELGEDFTSFNGSIFFNQNLFNILNFKLIDLLLLFILIFLLLKRKINKSLIISTVHNPIKMMALYLIILLCIDYYIHGFFDFGSIRRQLSMILCYYSLLILLENSKLIKFKDFLLYLLVIFSVFSIIRFLLFNGINSFRGITTIFWDSGLIYGLGIGCTYFFSRIISNSQSGKKNKNFISFSLILFVLIFALRRNIWLSIALGFFIIIFYSSLSKKIISFYIFLSLVFLFSIYSEFNPNSIVSRYITSMNVLESKNINNRSNMVHLENVLGYYQMVTDYPEILVFGRRSIKDSDFKNINKWKDYNLGTPHNAILAKIFFEGIISLILYMWLNIGFFTYCLKNIKLVSKVNKNIIIGIISFMIGHFILTLLFIPPETTFKGTFFILFFMLLSIGLIRENLELQKLIDREI